MKKYLKNKKVVGSIGGVFLILAGIVFFVNSKKNASVSAIDVQAVKDFVLYAEGRGQIQAWQEHFLTIKKGGRLDRLLVSAKTEVKQNQIIAVIDEASNKAYLESALSSYELANSELSRVRGLYSSRSSTDQELDQAKSSQTVKKAELKQYKQKLEDSLIRTPVEGFLSVFAFTVGDIIPDGSRVGVIEDRTKVRVVVSVPAGQSKKIPTHASVILQSIPPIGSTQTNIKSESIAADLSFANPGSDYDGMDVDFLVTFPTKPTQFQVGDAVKVKIPIENFPSVLTIPQTSMVWAEKSARLLLRDNKTGFLEWFEPNIISYLDDKIVVTALPEGKQLVKALSNRTDQMISKRTKTSVITSAPVITSEAK